MHLLSRREREVQKSLIKIFEFSKVFRHFDLHWLKDKGDFSLDFLQRLLLFWEFGRKFADFYAPKVYR